MNNLKRSVVTGTEVLWLAYWSHLSLDIQWFFSLNWSISSFILLKIPFYNLDQILCHFTLGLLLLIYPFDPLFSLIYFCNNYYLFTTSFLVNFSCSKSQNLDFFSNVNNKFIFLYSSNSIICSQSTCRYAQI